ncbi:hypothetical protein M2101_001289 [Parabacteroides sp. PM5-20]|uniref:heparinase II/III domain-containing protein n=1 Tax=unclassified Parabacteroides TaxID=2649774 RepID=UPI001EF26885|nr:MULTISPECIES: heparinase II/III family protein [unclassified Parabacteroides]MDH6534616.1 hypothetical protein [Parabacteroides sp. PM5-20]
MKTRIKKTLLFLVLTFCIACKGQVVVPTTVVFEQEVLPHPRLLFSKEQEGNVKERIRMIPLAEELYAGLLHDADSLLSVPVQQYSLRNGYIPDMLGISRDQIFRMITLSMAYRLSADHRYLEKAEVELVNVCGFPNWNPQHYLDVAEMTTAVAIGYDWLYADLEDTTKELIVQSIKTKALDLAIKEYAVGTAGSWAKRETNWNVVCNTGMVMGAMAIAEEYPELTETIIRHAVKYTPNCLQHFAPDGVCYEGPAYWGYTNIYLSLLLSVLNSNLGQDFGLSALEGIHKTALYYIHSTSPSGRIFNFANSGGTSPDTGPTFFFFSRHFNQPEVAAFYRNTLTRLLKGKRANERFLYLALPWFDNSPYTAESVSSKLNVYKGINDIAVLKGKGTTPHSIYLIAKGGDPDEAHQQMDVGTFIVESDGVRWSDDLGADSYDLPGFWDYKPDGQRWTYFRNTNFSHNTLAIDGKIQYAAGRGDVIDYKKETIQPFFTIDMTSAYEGQANSVLRTYTLTDDASVTITDKVNLHTSSQEITWSMITAANVKCEGKNAELSKNGKCFYLEILSPQNAVFTSVPAKTFTEKEKPVDGYRLLQVTVTGQKEQVIVVNLSSKSKNE